MSDTGEQRDKPAIERIDKGAEQRELEAAGWERMEREGKIVWRNPRSGFLYPQGAAIALVREGVDTSDIPKEPEGSA